MLRFRLGIACLVISTICLALLVLLVYPRYFMEDLFHALQWGPIPYWTPVTLGGVWVLATIVGYETVQASRSPARNTGSALYILLLIAFVYCNLLFPLLTKVPETPRFGRHGNSCSSHQHQLYSTILMYVQDHDMRLPTTWDEVEPYGATPDLYICPETKRYFHRLGGYGINANLRGKNLGEIHDPGSILLLADSVFPRSYLTTLSDIDRTRHGDSQRGFLGTSLDGQMTFFTIDAFVRLK